MQNYQREESERLGEEALKQFMEEEKMYARMDEERERKEQEWEATMDPLFDCNFPERFPEDDPDIIEYRAMKASIKFVHPTQESQVQPESAIEQSDPNTASAVEATQVEGSSGIKESDLQTEGSSAGKKKATKQKKLLVVKKTGSIINREEDQRGSR